MVLCLLQINAQQRLGRLQLGTRALRVLVSELKLDDALLELGSEVIELGVVLLQLVACLVGHLVLCLRLLGCPFGAVCPLLGGAEVNFKGNACTLALLELAAKA